MFSHTHTHTTTTTKINYEGLDVGSAANYHLRRVSWPQSVGSYPFLFSHFSWNQPPVSPKQIGWGAIKQIFTQIQSDNKSGMAVINSNIRRRLRDEGCCLVSTLKWEWRSTRERETSDLFKLHKCREGPLCFSGGCWLVPQEPLGHPCSYSYRQRFFLADAGTPENSLNGEDKWLCSQKSRKRSLKRDRRGDGHTERPTDRELWRAFHVMLISVNPDSPLTSGLTSSDLDDPRCHGNWQNKCDTPPPPAPPHLSDENECGPRINTQPYWQKINTFSPSVLRRSSKL